MSASVRATALVLPAAGMVEEARVLEALRDLLRQRPQTLPPPAPEPLRVQEGAVVGEARLATGAARITMAHLGN